jgi:hypothetical protein
MTVASHIVATKEKSRAALFGAKACSTLGSFFRISRPEEAIRPGLQFRRTNKDRTVETARVLNIDNDTLGIPHVRYELVIERAHRRFIEEPRILALKTFTDTYKEFF